MLAARRQVDAVHAHARVHTGQLQHMRQSRATCFISCTSAHVPQNMVTHMGAQGKSTCGCSVSQRRLPQHRGHNDRIKRAGLIGLQSRLQQQQQRDATNSRECGGAGRCASAAQRGRRTSRRGSATCTVNAACSKMKTPLTRRRAPLASHSKGRSRRRRRQTTCHRRRCSSP